MANPKLLFTEPIVNGSGRDNNENCSVELLGLAIYGDYRHGFRLPCIEIMAQNALIAINDRTSVAIKRTRRWRLLVARLGLCHDTTNERLRRRMGEWAIQSLKDMSVYLDSITSMGMSIRNVIEFWENETRHEHSSHVIVTNSELITSIIETIATHYSIDLTVAFLGEDGGKEQIIQDTNAKDEALLSWLDDYLSMWFKVAADEGCMIPEAMENEYKEFVEQLDFAMEDDG